MTGCSPLRRSLLKTSSYSGGSVAILSPSSSTSIRPASVARRGRRSLEAIRDEGVCARPDDAFKADGPAATEALFTSREVEPEVVSDTVYAVGVCDFV